MGRLKCSHAVRRRPDGRYDVVDSKSGAILDDANGYGYETAVHAHKAWSALTRPKKDRKRMRQRRRQRLNRKAWQNLV